MTDTSEIEEWIAYGGPWTLTEWREIHRGDPLSRDTWDAVREWVRTEYGRRGRPAVLSR
jgi:hypothetical protein